MTLNEEDNNDSNGGVLIKLADGKLALISQIDVDLAAFPWYSVGSSPITYVGCKRRRHGATATKSGLLHHVIMQRILQEPIPADQEVDHINRDGLDNRRSNLRLVSRAQNNRNRQWKRGERGVCFNQQSGKWRALLHIGSYDTKEEAQAAWTRAARLVRGESGIDDV